MILRSDERSLELENEIFNTIRNACKDYIHDLQNVAKVISEIDMLIALSIVARSNKYVRPTFSLYDEMVIENGRHPVIEAMSEKEFIPNHLKLYNND